MSSIPAQHRGAPLWLLLKQERAGAVDILRRFRVAAPPVDVVGLALQLGVEIVAHAGIPFDGTLESSQTFARITVNKDHPNVRRRFTIAHELGHLMLHPLGESFRDTAGQTRFDRREHAANQFAAELLMPAWLLKPLVPTFRSDVKGLARVFQVSEVAMGLRIRALYNL